MTLWEKKYGRTQDESAPGLRYSTRSPLSPPQRWILADLVRARQATWFNNGHTGEATQPVRRWYYGNSEADSGLGVWLLSARAGWKTRQAQSGEGFLPQPDASTHNRAYESASSVSLVTWLYDPVVNSIIYCQNISTRPRYRLFENFIPAEPHHHKSTRLNHKTTSSTAHLRIALHISISHIGSLGHQELSSSSQHREYLIWPSFLPAVNAIVALMRIDSDVGIGGATSKCTLSLPRSSSSLL
jgi:hypothetical protein